jgi:ATP-dependent helicase HrpB
VLPVADILPSLLALLRQHNRVILSAPPGAGKSTYLPLYLLQQQDFAGKNILMLEPRRLAAKSIASYLAAQLGEDVGATVGYQIRQEKRSSAGTRLLIVTEGVLTRKLQQDPELANIDLIIFDEFHERSLHADLALALCLDVQQLRDDIQLLIMSATLDMQLLADKLAAPVLESAGRSFPVTLEYAVPDNQPIPAQLARLVQQALQRHDGNILVFLPGQSEISQTLQLIKQQGIADTVQLHALLGSLTLAQQQAAIAAPPPGMRKVVLSTNLAETSLTIDGISVVIDSGLCRQSRFNPRHGISMLETAAISQAAAVQRAGRAGRLSAGVCYRLDTAEKWQRRARFTPAEIETADLSTLRLEVAAWGCKVDDLFWLTAPPAANLAVAEHLLRQLGFIDDKGVLTLTGRRAHQLGTAPRLAAMLLHGMQLQQQGYAGAAALACLLAALLEDSRALQGDIYSVLGRMKQALPQQWQQAQSFARLLAVQLTTSLPLELTAILALRAFPDRLAKQRGQGYQLANGGGAVLQDNHSLTGQAWLVVLHMQQQGRDNRIYHALSIEPDAILQDWQAALQWQTRTFWDDKSGSFTTEQQLNFGQCQLASKPAALQLTAEQKQQAWQSYIRANGLACLAWNDAALTLRARIALLRQYQPDAGWPDFSDTALLQDIADWLGGYLTTISKSAALAQLPLTEALLQRLSYNQQQQLQQLLPTHWQAPTGSKLAIDYLAEGGPRLSVRVQEMYGQMHSPQVLQGNIVLTIELLSPSRQPLQVTQNLTSFWQNAWHEVRKEMRGRYPKHYWPDDPAQAMPTTKTKKAMQK